MTELRSDPVSGLAIIKADVVATPLAFNDQAFPRVGEFGLGLTTPIGNGLVDGTFWIVSEHGRGAGYVRNIQNDPRVRVKLRQGAKQGWRTGTAEVLFDDDPRERQRKVSRGHPGRALNAFVVRTLGTDLLTVRIDLDA